ncbi:MAG: flagellar motor switch protein FliG [Pseudomonadales bacterium]
MSNPAEGLSGKSRAAILLMTLGEEAASEVLRHINPQEVQHVGQAMAEIGNVTREQVDAVIERFAVEIKEHTSLGIGSQQFLRTVLSNALGADRASEFIERILQGRNTKGLETLKWTEPGLVAELLREEHPQVVAVVLSHLSHERAAQVLKRLPAERHGDVLIRIANLEGIKHSALMELDEIMEKRIAQNRGDLAKSLGGKRAAADILNKLGPEFESDVIAKIRSVDDKLGMEIQELMFVFESLADLDDRSMQALLREVSSDQLGVALKGADPATQDKILSNMSSRAAEILKEDMEARGPVRLSEVEEAQKGILERALRLADEGKIQLGDSGEEYV